MKPVGEQLMERRKIRCFDDKNKVNWTGCTVW